MTPRLLWKPPTWALCFCFFPVPWLNSAFFNALAASDEIFAHHIGRFWRKIHVARFAYTSTKFKYQNCSVGTRFAENWWRSYTQFGCWRWFSPFLSGIVSRIEYSKAKICTENLKEKNFNWDMLVNKPNVLCNVKTQIRQRMSIISLHISSLQHQLISCIMATTNQMHQKFFQFQVSVANLVKRHSRAFLCALIRLTRIFQKI